jgi:hypothetical protein
MWLKFVQSRRAMKLAVRAHKPLANPTKTVGFKADGCMIAAIGFMPSIVLLSRCLQTPTQKAFLRWGFPMENFLGIWLTCRKDIN